ncbi:MAG TPA: GSCFA domain-containing protein, partial [Tangfeifania sp.]|nr:GSCFA domain-containing protein [Tangfeifania sp.]
PVSVAHALEFLLQKKHFTKDNLIQHGGLWHSFFHHSRFSSANASQALGNINRRIETSSQKLKKTDFLFITFGTSWVYEYLPTRQNVSNCHKIPAKEFRRFRLTVDEIVNKYVEIIQELRKINPEIKIIFTVSPIRHWKDGAVENQRSKATLLLAVDQIIKKTENNNCGYFPAYEIVMDELRDYRFYSEDMIHISDVAIKHIWSKFQNSLIEKTSIKTSEEVQKITNAVNHKPFNKFTRENLLFLKQSLTKVQKLQKEKSYLNLVLEKNYFSEQISEIEKSSEYFK